MYLKNRGSGLNSRFRQLHKIFTQQTKHLALVFRFIKSVKCLGFSRHKRQTLTAIQEPIKKLAQHSCDVIVDKMTRSSEELCDNVAVDPVFCITGWNRHDKYSLEIFLVKRFSADLTLIVYYTTYQKPAGVNNYKFAFNICMGFRGCCCCFLFVCCCFYAHILRFYRGRIF